MNVNKVFVFLNDWMLRVAVLLIAYVSYWKILLHHNLQALGFYQALVFAIGALLLLIGGFSGKKLFSVLGGALLVVVTGYRMFMGWPVGLGNNLILMLFTFASGFYFLANGK